MKNIMREAHKLTKEMKRKYPEVDYKTQLGLFISYLLENENKEVEEMKATPENILRKAEEITGVAPKRWENYGKTRYYFNYSSNKNIYFSFRTDGTVEAKANRPGATTEIHKVLESFGLKVVEKQNHMTIWK